MKKILTAIVCAIAALCVLDWASSTVFSGDWNFVQYVTEHKFIIAIVACYIVITLKDVIFKK